MEAGNYAPNLEPTKEILVKICLDQDQGLTPNEGRYRTFYNMYFINKLWVSNSTNGNALSKRFDSFVIAEYRADAAGILFSEEAYGKELTAWIEANIDNYYFLFPIITLKKGVYKFNGVHLPKYGTNAGSNDFIFNQGHMTPKALCIAGTWRQSLPNYSGATMNILMDSQQKKLLKNQENQIAEWVYGELDKLSAYMC